MTSISKVLYFLNLGNEKSGKGVENENVEEIASLACSSTVPSTSSIFVQPFLSCSEAQVVGTVCQDGSTQHAQKDQENNQNHQRPRPCAANPRFAERSLCNREPQPRTGLRAGKPQTTAKLVGKDAYSSTVRLLFSGWGRRSFLSEMLGEPWERNSFASARIVRRPNPTGMSGL